MVEHQPNEETQEPNEPQASACANSPAPSVTTPVQPADDVNTAPDIERFFCLHCGYDLTGHSGDTRRCPECGNTTWIEELKVALAIQEKGIGADESPVLPSLLFLPTAFFGFPSVVLFQESDIQWFSFVFLGFFAVSAAAWCWTLRMYFHRYGHHYDRLLFLGESHLLAVQIGFGGAFFGGSLLALVLSRFDTVVIVMSSASALFVAPSVWVYRDMKRRLRAYKLPKPPETNEDK